jgi:hypothetical protein
MTLEIMRALILLHNYCLEQNKCTECPLYEICMKQPSEWLELC